MLDLRLARLTKLEITKLEEELAQLKALINKLTAIIGSKKLQMDVVKEELSQIKRKYKDERRSLIVGSENSVKIDVSVQEKLSKNYVAAFTRGGMFKKIPEKNYRMSDKNVASSAPDDLVRLALPAESANTLLAFTNFGNAFKIDLEIAPESRFRDKGYKFTEIVKDAVKGEYPVAFFTYDKLPQGDLLFFTKQGMIKKTEWSEYDIIKSAYQAIKLKDGDELVKVEPDLPETTIAFITKDGLCLNALKDDIPRQGRVAGRREGHQSERRRRDRVPRADRRFGRIYRHHGRRLFQARDRGRYRTDGALPQGREDRRARYRKGRVRRVRAGTVRSRRVRGGGRVHNQHGGHQHRKPHHQGQNAQKRTQEMQADGSGEDIWITPFCGR